MEKDIKNLDLLREEKSKWLLKETELTFDCPHCYKEINETLFGEDGKKFRLFIDKCKEIAKEQWRKEAEETKKYEKLAGFTDLQKELKVKEEIIEKITRDFQEREKDYIKNIAEKTSPKVEELNKNIEEKNKEIEQLKVQEQTTIGDYKEKLATKEKELEKAKSDAKSAEVIMNSELYKNIEKERNEYKKTNEALNDPNYIENLKRVKDLEAEKKQLNSQIQELKDQGRMSKKKGENFEQYVSKELNRVFDDKDKISKITRLGGKADFLQEVLTENGDLAGRIIYEAKDGKSWKNEWENKLENDMANEKADFGIIIATCENGKSLRCLDPRKKIYVSDDENFVHFAKIMRDSLIQKHNNLKKNDIDDEGKEKRIKNFEEWISSKFPQYLSRLENELTELKKNSYHADKINEITRNAETNIRKIILEEVRIEISNL